VDKVRTALVGEKFKGPVCTVTMQENHHLINNVYIGETLANGQFKVIKTMQNVAAEPFSDKFLVKK
jgi:urea transport system substrate-binding protein